MTPTSRINVWEYVEIALRRKWLIILPFVLVASLSVAYALLSPNIYRSGTLIMVEPQKVPDVYIRSTVTASISERLRTISQQIMSRTMLEKIIITYDLYKKTRESLTMEEVVEEMRKQITLNVRGGASFSLFYQGEDPKTVAMVTNKLASLFIEENLKVREQHAEGTTEFLELELAGIRKQLVSQEEAVSAFKQRYEGELPGQLQVNLNALDRLQLQIQTNKEYRNVTEGRKAILHRQLTQMQPLATTNYEMESPVFLPDLSPPPQLVESRERLLQLQTRYTDKHPEVIKVQNEIRALEARLAKEQEENGLAVEDDRSLEGSSPGFSFEEMVSSQLAELDVEIRSLKQEEGKLKKEFKDYQRKVENTPKHEQEIMILTRDYENIKKSYQSLLNKKLEAQLAANMERKQKGERFRVLDPARVPEKPFKPNRRKIMLLGLILGLGIGGGLAFIAEYMDHSFRNSKELEEFSKLPVMASIPKIITEGDRKRKKATRKIIYASSVGVLVMVIATVAVHFFIFG